MKSAFTMIELIFVIVILGILASIAVPKLGAVKTKAEATKAQTAFVTVVKDVANGYLMAGNSLAGKDLGDLTNTDATIKINDQTCGAFSLDGTGDSRALIFTVAAAESGKSTLAKECADFLSDADKSERKAKWFASMNPQKLKTSPSTYEACDFSIPEAVFEFDLNNITAKKRGS